MTPEAREALRKIHASRQGDFLRILNVWNMGPGRLWKNLMMELSK